MYIDLDLRRKNSKTY